MTCPAICPPLCAGLVVGDGDDIVAVDRLDEAVAERVERRAEGADVLCGRGHALLDVRVGGAVVDERAARRVDEVAYGVLVTGAQFGDLADGAGDGVLVALGAGAKSL